MLTNRRQIHLAPAPVLIFTAMLALLSYAAATLLPAHAAKGAAAPKATFVGTDTCAQCHDEVHAQLVKQWHGMAMNEVEKKKNGYLCEGCHGPGSLHVADPSAATAAPLKKTARSGVGCLSCHRTRLSALKWLGSEHAKNGASCLGCHGQTMTLAAPAAKDMKDAKASKMDPKALMRQGQAIDPHAGFIRQPPAELCLSCHGEKRAELALPSHHPIPEGRVTCVDCHNPHEPLGAAVKRDVCVTCHVKQRGPFRYAHGAVSGHLTDACLDCHRPHGSPNQTLLKFNSRGLCLQCHADRATHNPGETCWDCHTAAHGSNTSALFLTE